MNTFKLFFESYHILCVSICIWQAIGIIVMLITELEIFNVAKNWYQHFFICVFLGPIPLIVCFLIFAIGKTFNFLGKF